ncbi:hypothetical protein H1P_370005 [Hyella patelloides LEGE 07179]|uniref:Beta-lactamase-related domain-containing protein n=1 Tax=Hyella patelloides LEGE 07179 TaxID=945734 RepID=A0A563VWI5_9CYAN|nr:hypothetical protein H1P_370005 [Hyella patelloides LEGE 07179]
MVVRVLIYCLNDILSDLDSGDRITIARLLNHTSSIVDYQDSEAYQNELLADPTRIWQPEEKLAYVSELEPYSEPGEESQYSASNYQLLDL